MHQIEPLVDLLKRRVWVIIGSISILPSMYQSTIFGTSVRPRAAKGGAAPASPGHKLERTGGDFLAGPGDADDDGFAHPLCAHSSAWRMTVVLPMHSKE